MRLDHLLSKDFCFGTARRTVKRIRFIDVLALFFWQRGTGLKGLGMLSGFWSSAPDLTPPIRIVIVCGCLFGVGVLVVNCIVDASIFDLCKQY